MQPFPVNSVIGTRHGAVTMPGGQQLLSPSSLSSGAGPDGSAFGVNLDVNLGSKLGGSLGFGVGRNGSQSGGGSKGGDEEKTPSQSQPPETGPNGRASKGGSRGSGSGLSSFFFRPGAQFAVSVWEDEARTDQSTESAAPGKGPLVGRGTLTLGPDVYVDSEAMNFDPYKKPERMAEWRYEFDQIGKEFD